MIILIVVIYNVFLNKSETEEIVYSNLIVNENIVEKSEVIEKIKVYVTGEVKNPGVIELENGARIEDAINKCEGVTEYANLKNVNLAYTLQDGQKLYIPNINDLNENAYITTENGEEVIENENNSKENVKININSDNTEELKNREDNGKFKNIEDLKNVSGIGDKKYESLKDFIDVK